jgi:DNA invertase Pin-like site-specific DNA recombinase
MRAAIYARVSTQNGQDPRMQTRELNEYCQRRGWTVEGQYIDVGVSGAKDSRPELNRLMADAKRRRFDSVLVWKLDRFGRSLRHLVNAIAELESIGVAFVSLTDNLDLSTPSGRLMFQVIAAMGEFERELIRGRVRSGMRNARAKGARIGRPKLKIDSAVIFRMRREGHRGEKSQIPWELVLARYMRRVQKGLRIRRTQLVDSAGRFRRFSAFRKEVFYEHLLER